MWLQRLTCPLLPAFGHTGIILPPKPFLVQSGKSSLDRPYALYPAAHELSLYYDPRGYCKVILIATCFSLPFRLSHKVVIK